MSRFSWRWFPLLLGASLVACASGSGGADPGETRGGMPDLRGRRVLVLPVQLRSGSSSSVTIDEELEYALGSRSERVLWVFPDEVERILQRSPGVQANLYGLPVGVFLQAEVNRIGDPLYGEIRRLTTLGGADVAIIPIQLRYGPDGAYHLVLALLDPVTGRVLWFSTIDGATGAEGSPGALASVADAAARAVAPLG